MAYYTEHYCYVVVEYTQYTDYSSRVYWLWQWSILIMARSVIV